MEIKFKYNRCNASNSFILDNDSGNLLEDLYVKKYNFKRGTFEKKHRKTSVLAEKFTVG